MMMRSVLLGHFGRDSIRCVLHLFGQKDLKEFVRNTKTRAHFHRSDAAVETKVDG